MARLRAESPVHRVRMGNEGEGWLVTRYADVKAASSGPRIGRDLATMRKLEREHSGGAGSDEADQASEEFDWLYREVLYLDPPDHTRLRKLVTKAFTAGAIGRLRPRIEQITSGLIDRMTGPVADLMPALDMPLPLIVICELLGVPEPDRPDFSYWSHILNGGTEDQAEITEVHRAVATYFGELADSKRAAPGDDLISYMVQAAEDGDRLSREEVISMTLLMLVAGHDTTVSLIGNGVLELLKAPGQLALLRSDPSLLPGAVEEMLRFACPVNVSARRFTRAPVELGGVTIPAGEMLFVSILSANRDATQFENPDAFDITRNTGGHLGFGHGIHYCLGAPLARLETAIAVGQLLERFPGLRLAADPASLAYRHSSLMHAPAELPVQLS